MKYNSILDLRQSIVLERAQVNFNASPRKCRIDDMMESYLIESSNDAFMTALKSIVKSFVQKVKEVISTIKVKILQSSIGKMLSSLNVDAAILEKSGLFIDVYTMTKTSTYPVVNISNVIKTYDVASMNIRKSVAYLGQMRRNPRPKLINTVIENTSSEIDTSLSNMEWCVTNPEVISTATEAANEIRSGMNIIETFLNKQESLTVNDINNDLKNCPDSFRMKFVEMYFQVKNAAINAVIRSMKLNLSTASRIHAEAQDLKQYAINTHRDIRMTRGY